MAARTYAPQLARKLQNVYKYWVKHQAKVQAVASVQQITDMNAIADAIASSWNAVPTQEQP
jgi:flagellin-specific chaperone FliS